MNYWPHGYWPHGYWPHGCWPAAVQRTRRDAGFARMATIVAGTLRPPVITGGKRGTLTVHLVDIRVTPLDPVDPETRQRLALQTPQELLQSFADGDLDILEGDVLVVAGVEYPVRNAAEWRWRGSQFVHLILEVL